MNNDDGVEQISDLLVTTTLTVDGYRVDKYLGIVRGLVVRSPTISQGIFGGFSMIIGGNIKAYQEMCEQARHESFTLMLEHARQVGANAILGVRYDATEIGGQSRSTEVLCYGTAVSIKPEA